MFNQILNITSSRSAAMIFREHYIEQNEDALKSNGRKWCSVQIRQTGIQIDEEILEDDLFVRYIDGSDKECR